MWSFAGHTLAHGEKRQCTLRVRVYDDPDRELYEIPATLICGAEEGQTVLFTACIHSDEYPAIPATHRAAREIDPARLKGNAVFMHCVNTSGFWANSIAVVPEDGFNLNSDYPGSADGGVGARLASWFVEQVFPKVDFVFDMHSGSNYEILNPCIFFPNAPAVRERALAAAKALEIDCLIQSGNRSGEVGYAAFSCGIPGLLAETGGAGLCMEEWVEAYRRNMLLLLKHLGCYDSGIERAPEFPGIVYTHAVYQKSDTDGLWTASVNNREFVRKGEVLGTVTDLFGNVLRTYTAEDDAMVFYHTGRLMVHAGEALIAYGIRVDIEELPGTHHCLDEEGLHIRLGDVLTRVREIDRLIGADVPCEQIAAALSEASELLRRCERLVLEDHMKHCVHGEHHHHGHDDMVAHDAEFWRSVHAGGEEA